MSRRSTPVILRATACLGAVAAIGASALRAAPWEVIPQLGGGSAKSALLELGDRGGDLDRSSLALAQRSRTSLVSSRSSDRAGTARRSGPPTVLGKAVSAVAAGPAESPAPGPMAGSVAPADPGAAAVTGADPVAGNAATAGGRNDGRAAAGSAAPAPSDGPNAVQMMAATDRRGQTAAPTAAPTTAPTAASSTPAGASRAGQDEQDRTATASASTATRSATAEKSETPDRTAPTTRSATATPTSGRSPDR